MKNQDLVKILYAGIEFPTYGMIRENEDYKLFHNSIGDTYWIESENHVYNDDDEFFWKLVNETPEFKNYFLQIGW